MSSILIGLYANSDDFDRRRKLASVSEDVSDMLFDSLESPRRYVLKDRQHYRRTQDFSNSIAIMNVRNCTFMDNEPGAPSNTLFTQHTLITLENNDNEVNVEDTLFYNNDYDNYAPVRKK